MRTLCGRNIETKYQNESTMSSISMDSEAKDGPTANGSTPRNAQGWDGKLRVEKKAVITNPEALTDPDYSNDEAPSPEVIEADDGKCATFPNFVS